MNDTLIINGITYKAVKEEKSERLSGYVNYEKFKSIGVSDIDYCKVVYRDTRMVELRDGEIIVSEDDVRYAWKNYMAQPEAPSFDSFLRHLGFKESGKV